MTLAGYPVIIPGVMNRISHFLMQLLPVGLKLRFVSGSEKEISYSI